MQPGTLIYDGDCAFCTRAMRWIMTRITDASTATAAQQLDDEALTTLGLTRTDVTAASYWIDADGTTHRGSRAVAKALVHARQPWRTVGILLWIPPISWLAIPGYELVARNRHRLPGATESCRLGDP